MILTSWSLQQLQQHPGWAPPGLCLFLIPGSERKENFLMLANRPEPHRTPAQTPAAVPISACPSWRDSGCRLCLVRRALPRLYVRACLLRCPCCTWLAVPISRGSLGAGRYISVWPLGPWGTPTWGGRFLSFSPFAFPLSPLCLTL